MKINIPYLIFLVIISCGSQEKTNQWNLGSIEVKQLTPNSFQHISYLQTEDFEMDFIANGFLFERQLDFLQDLDLGSKLVVEETSS